MKYSMVGVILLPFVLVRIELTFKYMEHCMLRSFVRCSFPFFSLLFSVLFLYFIETKPASDPIRKYWIYSKWYRIEKVNEAEREIEREWVSEWIK